MNREIILEMYEKLWNADKDKWAWNVILKDTLEKIEKCKHIKREGESCRLNNNCTYPDCEIETLHRTVTKCKIKSTQSVKYISV